MSSHDNSHQNNVYVNQTWDQNFTGEENIPRPPNPVTESRVLSRLLQNQASRSQSNAVTSNPSRESQSAQVTSSPKSQQPLTLPEVRNQLSAEAKEFVPRSQATLVSNFYPGQEYTQDDLYSLSVTAEEFIPRVPEEYSNYSGSFYPNVPYEEYEQEAIYLLEDMNSMSLHDLDSPYGYEVRPGSTDNPILYRFNQALHILNMHPGNMEEYLRPICEMICNCSDAAEIVNDIVESLFNQSLQEANFRYTGARICQFLNNNLKGNPFFSEFNKIFINRCQKEYTRCQELKNGSQDDQERLRGLAMFMAEIFLNVETETKDGTAERLHFLPGILVDFVKTLLTSPSDLDVKCSCQLLKLSGGLIEDVMKHAQEDYKKFEEIFSQLQSLQSSPKLTENTKFLIGTVIKLKNSDWNRSSSSPTKKSLNVFSTESNNFQAPEPVFYNLMGAPCSRTEAGIPEEDTEDGAYILNEEEEDAFLKWQAEQEGLTDDQGTLIINDSGYDSYQIDDSVDEGGMGDEMEAAYEEFLQKQSFMQGYQPQHVGVSEQQIHTPVHPMFTHPPPNIPSHQVFNGYQQQHVPPPNQLQHMPLSSQQPHLPPPSQQQHMLPPNQQPNQMPQQHHIQQQQNQQAQYPNSDRFHFRRL